MGKHFNHGYFLFTKIPCNTKKNLLRDSPLDKKQLEYFTINF